MLSCKVQSCRCVRHRESRVRIDRMISHIALNAPNLSMSRVALRSAFAKQVLAQLVLMRYWKDSLQNDVYLLAGQLDEQVPTKYFPHSWRKLPQLLHFLIWHLSGPTVEAAAVSGISVRCSCRDFGTSIIAVMPSFQVGCLSCTDDQNNSEMFSFGMQGRASHDVSVVICK